MNSERCVPGRQPHARTPGARLSWVFITPDGRHWAHSDSRLRLDLYLVEAVR